MRSAERTGEGGGGGGEGALSSVKEQFMFNSRAESYTSRLNTRLFFLFHPRFFIKTFFF